MRYFDVSQKIKIALQRTKVLLDLTLKLLWNF